MPSSSAGICRAPCAVPVRHPLRAARKRARDHGQLRAEGRSQRRDRARHGDPARARVLPGDLEAETGQRVGDELEVGRVGSVAVLKLAPGEPDRHASVVERQLGAPPGHDRQLDAFRPVDGPGRFNVGQRPSLAAGQLHERVVAHVAPSPSPWPRWPGRRLLPRGGCFTRRLAHLLPGLLSCYRRRLQPGS